MEIKDCFDRNFQVILETIDKHTALYTPLQTLICHLKMACYFDVHQMFLSWLSTQGKTSELVSADENIEYLLVKDFSSTSAHIIRKDNDVNSK